MIQQIGSRLSYANVMSTLALFAVLGGGAYAAARIGSEDIERKAVRAKHIKKQQVRTKHLKNAAVTNPKLADGAVATAKLADDAATGAKVNESTLGTVPDADRLDGVDSPDLLRGTGRVHAARGSDAPGGSPSAPIPLDIGGTLTLECNNPASAGSTFRFTNTSGGTADVWTDKVQDGFAPGTTIFYSAVPDGGSASTDVSGPVVSSGRSWVRFTIGIGGRVSTIDARLIFVAPGECQFTALISELRT